MPGELANNPLHAEARAARFGKINVVCRGPVNAVVIWLGSFGIGLDVVRNTFSNLLQPARSRLEFAMKNILVPGLLGFVFLSLGTVGTILTWEQWRLGSESKNWPSTQGQILKSEIRSTSGTNSSAYPVIHYQYQVDGQLLKSETIRFAAIGGKGPNNANEVVRIFPNGATAEVFYNPEDPSQAVLQPGVFSRTYGLLAAGATSLLFGMFCVFYGTRQYMKMHHMA